ncbi:hypothetical protein SAMN05443668_10198 [Cryptosporangium aurantiacum]|uniref:Uncharacterized protein n=1 Tax=Cryptosporangium aurantiacum TaxID=134849 RepID=A0A1M7H7X6_9ACTN|nr:hypothetical protein SAMN05443668_10198 [Cryptosporangium aurantiacum]
MADRDTQCDCGHAECAHRHYRRGTDCALCDCPRYRPRGGLWTRLRARFPKR